MTKTIQEQIKEHEQAIERLKAVESGVWKPERGDYCYKITDTGDTFPHRYNADLHDEQRLSIGNCFRTLTEVKRVKGNLTTIQAIKDWIAENDIEALSLDWNDAEVSKFSFYYSHNYNEVFIDEKWIIQSSILPHLSSVEKAKACLEFIGEDKIAALYGVYND